MKETSTTSSPQNLKTFIQGFVMGIAEVLPAVSGSTFALIMGIYDDFINLLHDGSKFLNTCILFVVRQKSFEEVRRSFKSINWKFGLPLAIGLIASTLLLSNVLVYLLEKYPREFSAYFFGLVIASVTIPWKEMKSHNAKLLGVILVVAAITFIILGIRPVNYSDLPSAFTFFIGGILGVTGVTLPGISGSSILLLMGLYGFILELISKATSFDLGGNEFLALMAFFLGMIVGVSVYVRILKYALDKAPNVILAVLVGLMLGSLRVLWPFFEMVTNLDGELEKSYLAIGTFETSTIIEIIVFILLGILSIIFVDKFNVVDNEGEVGKIKEQKKIKMKA